MSRYSGKMGKGFSKILRELKREEADERNTLTLPERRRAARRSI